MSTPEPDRSRLNPAVAYTAGRVALFFVVAALLYLVGFRTFALVLLALVISMPLSYVVLRRQREAFADQVERRVERRRAEKEKLRAALRGDDAA
jgi:C4-dicarboxylate-specific signal transduction histidine kinase